MPSKKMFLDNLDRRGRAKIIIKNLTYPINKLGLYEFHNLEQKT